MRLRPCLHPDCTALTPTGSRCPQHRTTQRAKYRGGWPNYSRQRIHAHIQAHGPWCPGWHTPPHPSTDLTVDHQTDLVICRACNTRKRNLGHG